MISLRVRLLGILCIIFTGSLALGQPVDYDSLGTYTVEGSLHTLDHKPMFATRTTVQNWPKKPDAGTNLDGAFSIQFNVTKEQYDYAMQVYVEFRPADKAYATSGVSIPIRSFHHGYYNLGDLTLLTREEASAQRAAKTVWGYLESRIDSLKTLVDMYPGKIDSLKNEIAKLRRKQVKYIQHVVKPGDWLTKIAADSSVYGDEEMWKTIYDANRDIIDNPNLIYPNQILKIPVNPTRK